MPGPSRPYEPDPGPSDPAALARERLLGGASRAVVARLLQGRGLAPEEARRLVDSVHLDLAREELPARLRASGRRQVLLSLIPISAGGAVLGISLVAGRIAGATIYAVLVLVAGLAELGWGLSRFEAARSAERGERLKIGPAEDEAD